LQTLADTWGLSLALPSFLSRDVLKQFHVLCSAAAPFPHPPILNDPPLLWIELASSVPRHFVTKSIVKASLPEIGVVTGQPQVDVKGVVILAALVTSIIYYFGVLNRQAFTKTSKTCTLNVYHADMTVVLS
jgi:hypothetical protein